MGETNPSRPGIDEPREDRVAALYRSYGPVIYARCMQLLREPASAEDATQETFVRVHRHIARAPDGKQALLWIYRIATNYCLNEIRDRKHRPVPTDDLPEAGTATFEQLLDDRDLVARLVERAPERVRVVAWLSYIDGLDQGEVADVMQISRRTVVNHLATFKKNSRKFLHRSQR